MVMTSLQELNLTRGGNGCRDWERRLAKESGYSGERRLYQDGSTLSLSPGRLSFMSSVIFKEL